MTFTILSESFSLYQNKLYQTEAPCGREIGLKSLFRPKLYLLESENNEKIQISVCADLIGDMIVSSNILSLKKGPFLFLKIKKI